MTLGRFSMAALGGVAMAALVLGGLRGVAAADNPEHLDRAAISSGISKIKPKVLACRDKAPDAKGQVKVKVAVAPEGKVTSATIDQTPNEALGTCVAEVMKTAKFGASKNGGSFIYPFLF
jgi:TonB family protein